MRVHCIVTIHFEFLKNSRSHLAEAQERITSGYKQTGGGGGGGGAPFSSYSANAQMEKHYHTFPSC